MREGDGSSRKETQKKKKMVGGGSWEENGGPCFQHRCDVTTEIGTQID